MNVLNEKQLRKYIRNKINNLLKENNSSGNKDNETQEK